MIEKYCCGFQALYSKWVAATSISLSIFSSTSTLLTMDARKGSNCAEYVAKYLKAQDNNSSDEERQQIETFEFDDFEPFMVLFRHYRPALSETEKQDLWLKSLQSQRKSSHVKHYA